jgi:protein O-GlcNAc transferase
MNDVIRDLLTKAVQAQRSGDLAASAARCREVLDRDPANFQALHFLGRLRAQEGDFPAAAALIAEAIAINSDAPAAHYNLGLALRALNRHGEAIESYRQALRLKSDFAAAHNDLGIALNEQSRPEEALACLRRALALQPASPELLNNLGIVLTDLHHFPEAEEHLRQALLLRSDYAEAHSNLGNVHKGQRAFVVAVECYRRALALDPDNADAQHNLGMALRNLGRHDEAVGCFRRALARDPASGAALIALAVAERQICDWRTPRDAQIKEHVERGDAAIEPFDILSFSSSGPEQLRCARNYWAGFAMPDPLYRSATPRPPGGKIRIAYLSFDFHAHATAYLLVELLERHDRAKFDVVAVSFGPDDDSPMRRRLVAAVDRFVDVRHLGDAAVARLITEMPVDIAVDLNGLAANNRRNILAHRPAPIQVNYLGFPGTMGAPFIDYIIVDRFVAPPEAQPHFSERLVHLPDCYQPNDSRRRIADETPTRAESGLPESGFVFACFNNSYKITPTVFDVWCRLLCAVPGGVLWLLQDNEWAAVNLRREAATRGVAPERLVFAPRRKPAEHLARHRRADLFLDTLPYGAHTTASDALWAGLPIVTCAGATFASRVAGSLLRAAGLPELVTGDLAAYEGLALRLASDPAALATVKARLAANRATAPLFDTERYRRGIEAAYLDMVAAYRRDGTAPPRR